MVHFYCQKRYYFLDYNMPLNFIFIFLQNELKDLEEKFRKAMVNNAGLDNEKSALTYQVELLKDQMEECEEQSALVTKELREKSRDFELLKRGHAETQRAVQLLQVTQFKKIS